MKKLKIILLVLIIICLGLLLNYESRKEYKLELPDIEKVVSINLIQNDKGILISNEDDIKNIFNLISQTNKTTKRKSDGSNITKLNSDIKIEFNYEDKLAKVVYLYNIENDYYLEQYKNGIYNINKDIYNPIESYIK